MPPYQRGTGFTNLQTYLGLNKGVAGQMGGALAQQAEQQGSAARQAIDADVAKANAAVQAGGTGQAYSGPQTLGNMGSLYGQTASAQNYANALGSNTGRATLLGQQYGQNTWGGGQLDAALAGAGAAGGRMATARGQYGKLLEYLQGAQRGVETAAQKAQETTAAPPQKPGPYEDPALVDKKEQIRERKAPRGGRNRYDYEIP